MGEAFDDATPFRAIIGDIAKALSRDVPCSVQLPEYQAHEDFVAGTLQFGGEEVSVYWNTGTGATFPLVA